MTDRVLVTGAAGFIGRALVTELRSRGADVLGLDSLRSDVHATDAAPVGVVLADVRDRAALEHALRGVDVVCHLAAKVGLGVGVEDLPDYADTNVHGTAVLLAAMAAARVQRLVLASSMVVYGEGRANCPDHGAVVPGPRADADLAEGRFEPPCPRCGISLRPALVDEDTPPDPRNGYAATKIAQEHLASAWARSTGGCVTTLRYHNVYGPGMPRDTPYAGVAAIFLSALRSGRAPLVHEDGGQRRDFVHVADVATATAAAAERGEGGVFNVGSGTVTTVGELATALAVSTGGPAPRLSGTYRLGDVRHVTADSARLRRTFGWRPRVDLASGLAEFAR